MECGILYGVWSTEVADWAYCYGVSGGKSSDVCSVKLRVWKYWSVELRRIKWCVGVLAWECYWSIKATMRAHWHGKYWEIQ